MSIRGVNVGGNLFDITDSSNVAPIELTNFATRNYAKDRCFIMIDGLLYRAMVAISSGDPIVINGNAKRTTLDEMFSVVETDSDLIAPTEDGATSSDDYAIGAQIVRSGILYKVIDDIAEGDAFVVDNNIQLAGSVSEQISSIDEALTNEIATTTVNGAHNLLKSNVSTQVVNGVTFTVQSDGSFVISGAVTEGQTYASLRINENISAKAGQTYKIHGGLSEHAYVNVWSGSDFDVKDYGSDNINSPVFTPSADETALCAIVIDKFATLPLTIEPMITLASDPSSEFTPYAMTNRELTDLFIIENRSFNPQTVATGAFSIAIDVAKSGYDVMGVVGYNVSRISNVFIHGVYRNSSTKIGIDGNNNTGSSQGIQGQLWVLYKKLL